MARPQTRNGYSRIANELIEAFAQVNLRPYEWRVLMYVVRKTYGWNKKSDVLSVSQIAEGTKLQKPHACRAKNSLVKKNILRIEAGKTGLNKDYESWAVTNLGTVPKSVTNCDSGPRTQIVTDLGTVPVPVTSVTGSGNKSLPEQALQKTIKDTITKDNTTSVLFGSPEAGNHEKKISPEIHQVFDAWNRHAGKSVRKPDGRGTTEKITWKGHTKLSKDKLVAIKSALKDYSVEDIVGAIDNFSAVLLDRKYFWSYPWTLHEFLTRGEEKHKAAARKWWQFLADNFDAARYLRHGPEPEVLYEDPSIEEGLELARKLDRQAAERPEREPRRAAV